MTRPTVHFRASSFLASVASHAGLLGLAALAGVSAGCSGATKSSDDSADIQSQLALDNGGMTNADERPMFADDELEAIPGFESLGADATDMTTEAAAQPGATRYHVALLWGHLPAPADASASDTDPVAADWTGSVSVDAGAIGVKKTLMFDRADHLDPRTSAQTVSFDSHTLPFVDGLFLHVVVPANGTPVLHFSTASLKTDIDLSQLATKEGGVTRIPNGPNGLAYVGYSDVEGCARGLVFGRWVKTRAQLGRFRGQVVDGDGERIGHVRGIWGHAPRRDADVFFGKYIALDGTHRGLFGGQYGDGHFAGLWGTRDPGNIGTLEGVYSDGYDRDDGRGVYLGRWSEKCR